MSAKHKVLNSTVVKLGLISLFADISSEMLYPINPLFLTTVLGASMTSLGFIEGTAEAIASLLKTYSGAWSDRISKRKPFIVIGYFLSAIAKPFTGFATSWIHVLTARSMDRIGKGFRGAPRDAMISEAVHPSVRGEAFGYHRAMDTLGAAIGPLFTVFFVSIEHTDLRHVYFLAAIPGLFAVIITLFLRDSPKSDHYGSSHPSRETNKDLKKIPVPWSVLPKAFKMYLFAWLLFSIANSSDVFLLMAAKEKGLPFDHIVFIYCLYNLSYSFLSPSFGKLSDKIGRKNVLITGLLTFAFVYFGFSVASLQWHFWLLFGIYGLYMAATDGVGKAFAIDLVDPSTKATGIGILGTITGLSTVIASTVGGLLWDRSGSSWTFLYGVTGAVLSIFVLFRIPVDSKVKSVG